MALAEATIKMFPAQDAESAESKFWTYDAELGWFHVPGSKGTFHSRQHGYKGEVSFDEQGFRSTGGQPPANAKKILIVGDSTTVGQEVDDNETYPAVLERSFAEAGKPVKVYNAGVRGYGADQVYLLVKRLVPRLKPDLVLYMFSDNDFPDVVTVKNRHRLYSKPAFFLEDGKLRPTNIPAGKFDLEYFEYIDCEGGCRTVSGQAKAGGAFAWMRKHSFFYKYFEDFYYVKLSPTASFEQKVDNAYAERLFPYLLAEMKKEAPNLYATSFTENGGPNRGGYDYSWETAKKSGVRFLDIRPKFELTGHYIYPVDGHWTEKGHRVAGEALYGLLKDKL
ncbi:MAG: SGNH/GDSL hydrolase family protein [Elusimicrobia bacterium]|nr:SGNH/GDSL hydrolase family protein [Elusimicrobiota bacterium]